MEHNTAKDEKSMTTRDDSLRPSDTEQQKARQHSSLSQQTDNIPTPPKRPGEVTTVTPNECISHLKLLAALAQLRESVSSTAGAFNIDKAGNHRDVSKAQGVQDRVQEKKWQVFVSRAVDRFTQWWLKLPTYKDRPTVMSLKKFEMDPLALDKDIRVVLTKDELPPLDVLMIWHTYMLNPRAYLEDCFRQAKMNVWSTPFPLHLIAECISVDEGNRYLYNPGTLAPQAWTRMTGRKWDNFDDPSEFTLACPFCENKLQVPWTTAHISMVTSTTGKSVGFQAAEGYADPSFRVHCPGCNANLDHHYLSMLKFHFDNLELIDHEIPLPGTLFNANGVVKSRRKWGAKWKQLASNYYFIHFNQSFLHAMKKPGLRCRSIRGVADLIYKDLYKRDRKIKALDINTDLRSASLFGGAKGRGRGALRRMMSRYWGGNSSIFALDLVGAVMRQGTFITKMQGLDWLHLQSPVGLPGLMQRCIQKYSVFWSIIVKNPSKIVVPTLDVDLVWHTHQLDPRSYYEYSLATTAAEKPIRFIDHDDKIDEGQLSDSFAWTVKQYRKATRGMVYSECFCWYCAATRGEGLLEKLSHSSTTDKASPVEPENPGQDAHISAHSAVRSGGEGPKWRRKKLDRIVRKHQGGKDTDKMKTKKDRKIIDTFEQDPPLHCDAYISNPACFSVAMSAEGNCVAGTCVPSAAAGGCGGSNLGSACATGIRYHGGGFAFIQNTSAGGAGGGGVGCGGGC
ncbi:hypothetical protein ARAM_004096 [Aspergillus rambellii]|uniref:Alpha-ketoglutarate-dependent sulfonate dioxygenase n=1 Tax=Aspergillus rambellii TaxID=308745 RepID=A0A0F8XV46_9EURO|nr:hypothetical protein ARAM_004096 [Aspergillus rambellii]